MKTILPILLLCAAPVWSAPPYAYITNGYGSPHNSSVSVIDWTANLVVATVGVQQRPRSVAVTPNGAFAYVLCDANVIYVIATSTNTVIARIPVQLTGKAGSDLSLAITPDGAFVYLAHGDLTVISTASNTIVTVVPIGDAFSLAITPDGRFAYITQYGLNSVWVVATATNSVVALVSFPAPGPAWAVAIAPNGEFAYITNQGVSGSAGTLAVVATATNTVQATIPFDENFVPGNLAITPNGASVYVLNVASGNIAVVATATNTVSAMIPLDGFARGMAICPDGTLAYVPLVSPSPMGQVQVINTATNTRFFTSSTGGYGGSVAFVPSPPPSLPHRAVQMVVKESGMCLDVQSYAYEPGAPAIQYWCEGGLNQRWLAAPVGDGSFTLTAQHSGQVLDVTGESTAIGAQPIQYPYWGGRNQHWYFEQTLDGHYHVVAQNSGLCLDVVTSLPTPALTQQSTCGPSDSQKWKLVPWQWW